MIKLRPYQENIINELATEYQLGRRAVVLVSPCGSGKTVMVGWLASATALKKRRVLFLVHRQELIDQSSSTFTAMGINHGIIAAGQPKLYERLVQVGSVQTVARRLADIPAPDYIIVDESHHITAATYRRIIEYYPKSLLLGVTATPERMGGQGLGSIFNSMVLGPSVKELISWGNLAAFDVYAPPAKFDADLCKVKFGDYVKDDLLQQVDKADIIGDLVKTYNELAPNMRAVCYCVSLEHSKHVADTFNKAGIKAQHIDGDTDKNVRNQVIRDFRDGRVQIICNVDLISEGFDVPAMEAVILARPTASLTLYIQQAMRAMRPDSSNPNKRAVIIDHVGNVFRHGLPDEEHEWSLEDRKKKKRNESRGIAIKACPKCYQVHAPAAVCPYCGWAYPISMRETMPDEKDGKLLKIESVEDEQRREKQKEVGRARTIEELEKIALKRGYSMGWVKHIANARRLQYART